MPARIALVDGAAHELASLYSWLQYDEEFRGRVKPVTARLKPGDMGGVTEVLTVALGGGGAVAALGAALNGWLSARRARISVEITNGDRTRRVEIDSANASTASQLLREAFEATGEPS
ncbi:effector-associated constant component EACC1 [Micromonospora chersina]|uniref:effector-associated constant component EACC1 n=1 Tax=Micromonospora chersina TaxID=47854 RepID=UPI003697B873